MIRKFYWYVNMGFSEYSFLKATVGKLASVGKITGELPMYLEMQPPCPMPKETEQIRF